MTYPSKAPRLIAVALLLLLAGCAGPEDAGEGTVISTTLRDDSIVLDQSRVPSGVVSFEITNDGTLIHEVEVFAGDRAELPVASGVADTAGLVIVDELEDIPPGATLTLEVDLGPGHYIILCNLPGHYQAGMVTELDVSG